MTLFITGNTITLNGSCNIGATWSGGLGTFDDNSLLNATYIMTLQKHPLS